RPPLLCAARVPALGERRLAGGARPVRRAVQCTTRSGGGDVSELAETLSGIPEPLDRWDESAAAGLSVLDLLVYRSNLLGADRALANQGGGNTSAKETIVDHAGRETRGLWVKGSGTALASINTAGLPRPP